MLIDDLKFDLMKLERATKEYLHAAANLDDMLESIVGEVMLEKGAIDRKEYALVFVRAQLAYRKDSLKANNIIMGKDEKDG